MSYLNAALSQILPQAELASAVRCALGKPLRRAAPFTQQALIGALACLSEAQRHEPTALLWQSTVGPRAETQALLDEIRQGNGEPMPYDFLATQPAIAAAQIQPFLPGLVSASHFPLAEADTSAWSLLLTLADRWLVEGRYAHVLCAQLDLWQGFASGHWLLLSRAPLEMSAPRLHFQSQAANNVPDQPDFPAHVAAWLKTTSPTLALPSPFGVPTALEFVRP